MILFKYNFLKVSAVAISGGVFGSVLFTYVSDFLLKWWERYKHKHLKIKKKIFTKGNRRIIKIKHRFGLAGIAILSPVLLSIPLGAFLGDRFYKNKKKVIIYLCVSVIGWNFILYFLFYFFHDSLKAWLG